MQIGQYRMSGTALNTIEFVIQSFTISLCAISK
jgi:hypothetical protein